MKIKYFIAIFIEKKFIKFGNFLFITVEIYKIICKNNYNFKIINFYFKYSMRL